jgi:ATPase subunit of ABC transporter with duplicated ATPase domains
LGGEQHAHRPIKTLSGGERMRLCFGTELADEPHVLILDEFEHNHPDLETLDGVAVALDTFQGAVVIVSRNQGLLRIFANTLWTCGNDDPGQQVVVLYSDKKEGSSSLLLPLTNCLDNTILPHRSTGRRIHAE